MPNPKRRHSKSRTAKRRTHDALTPVIELSLLGSGPDALREPPVVAADVDAGVATIATRASIDSAPSAMPLT